MSNDIQSQIAKKIKMINFLRTHPMITNEILENLLTEISKVEEQLQSQLKD